MALKPNDSAALPFTTARHRLVLHQSGNAWQILLLRVPATELAHPEKIQAFLTNCRRNLPEGESLHAHAIFHVFIL